jgi:hypothetical protein
LRSFVTLRQLAVILKNLHFRQRPNHFENFDLVDGVKLMPLEPARAYSNACQDDFAPGQMDSEIEQQECEHPCLSAASTQEEVCRTVI